MVCECGLGAKCVMKSTSVDGVIVMPISGSKAGQAHDQTYQLTSLAQRGRKFLSIQVPISVQIQLVVEYVPQF